MTNHDTNLVFTPTIPATLSFVERDTINDRIVDALRTPGKQIVVYGHSGSGKTTLLQNKLRQLYEGEVITRCVAGLTFDQLVLDAFDRLGAFYVSEEKLSVAHKKDVGLKAKYLEISAQTASADASTRSLILPPQLTAPTLARFLGAANYCWVLEDFHKITPSEKAKLAQMMKVFMDTAVDYPDLRIVAVGAVGTARQVVEYDSEMRNRVTEVEVPLMTENELRDIIRKGEDLLNIHIPERIKLAIVKYSGGLASICHQLCLNLCQAADIVQTCPRKTEVGGEYLEVAIQRYLRDASDTLRATFDKALRNKKKGKYDNTRMILRALASCPEEGATHGEILPKIRRSQPEYPAGNLNHFLKELRKPDRGGVLRYDEPSGRHAFADPIFRVYAQLVMKQDTQRNVVVINTKELVNHMFGELIVSHKELKAALPVPKDKT